MARAFLGLGSNMGDRRAQLQAAIAQLPDLVAVSALYETQPLGGPPGQSPYLNMVVELDTDLSPRQLLELGQSLEGAAGRVRGTRWGPRPLDVDVLLVEDQVVDSDDLVVPHPRMWERRFVLAPLSDLAPELVPPGLTERAVGEVKRLGSLTT
jgi:2-amino-4-hydroxy-6-hydroxymethyldihydropteridine diphosphokinase